MRIQDSSLPISDLEGGAGRQVTSSFCPSNYLRLIYYYYYLLLRFLMISEYRGVNISAVEFCFLFYFVYIVLSALLLVLLSLLLSIEVCPLLSNLIRFF